MSEYIFKNGVCDTLDELRKIKVDPAVVMITAGFDHHTGSWHPEINGECVTGSIVGWTNEGEFEVIAQVIIEGGYSSTYTSIVINYIAEFLYFETTGDELIRLSNTCINVDPASTIDWIAFAEQNKFAARGFRLKWSDNHQIDPFRVTKHRGPDVTVWSANKAFFVRRLGLNEKSCPPVLTPNKLNKSTLQTVSAFRNTENGHCIWHAPGNGTLGWRAMAEDFLLAYAALYQLRSKDFGMTLKGIAETYGTARLQTGTRDVNDTWKIVRGLAGLYAPNWVCHEARLVPVTADPSAIRPATPFAQPKYRLRSTPEEMGDIKPVTLPEGYTEVPSAAVRPSVDVDLEAHKSAMRTLSLRRHRAETILVELQAAEALDNLYCCDGEPEADQASSTADLLRESARTWA